MAQGRKRYSYEPPSYDETVERAERKGSMFDAMFRDVKLYRPKQGVNSLRILPPTWKGAHHYGLPVYVHRNVGPNDRTYLCLRENDSSPHDHCPPCDELFDLGSRATKQEKDELRPNVVMAFYVVDRDAEEEGVQVWLTSMRNDSEIAAQSINRRNKSVLNIVDPDEGYDIEFSRSGTTMKNTQYRGFQVMREWSPLHDNEKKQDAWLDEIAEHPLTERLQFFSPEHILKAMTGRATKDDDDNDRRDRRRGRDDDDDGAEDRQRRRGRSRDDDDEPQPRQRRRPSADDDGEEEERPSRRRARDEEEERPSRRAGHRDNREGDDADDERPSRRRTRSEEELDDEIPSDAGRRRNTNGRDDDDEEERPSRRARGRDENAEEDGETRVRSRGRANGEDAEEAPRRARRTRQSLDEDADDDSGGDDGTDRSPPDGDAEERRQRMRDRLRR